MSEDRTVTQIYSAAAQVAQAIEKWRPQYAATMPFGIGMAVAQRESMFDVNAVPIDPKTGKPRSSARGIWQILKGSIAGYLLASLDERLDVDKSTKGAMKVLGVNYRWILRAFPKADPDEVAGLVYLGHWQGQGSLQTALETMKARGLAPTIANAAAVLGVSPTPLEDVRSYWRWWEKAKQQISGDFTKLVAWGTSQRSGPLQASVRRGRRRRTPPDGDADGGGVFVLALVLVALGMSRR